MKYQCLVVDHDDTVVDSTRLVHYPCFMEYVRKFRPNFNLTFEEYIWKNFTPGFIEYFIGELGFTRADLVDEEKYWNKYVKEHILVAYDGWKEILTRYKNQGGIVCVVSHSLKENIIRDYKENDLPIPDDIFGWELPEELRKPSPYAIYEIEKKYELRRHEILMVDDLKPGYDMARKVGVDFAGAGWGHNLPLIQNFLQKNSDYYLQKVEDLERILL